MRISFKQLALFVATAQCENITQAAEKVYLSQPAASMTLHALETQLNTPLFHRQGKKLTLNSAGKKLFPKAMILLDQLKEIKNLFESEKSLSGDLNLTASTTIGNYLIPKLIEKFKTHFPEVNIRLNIANTKTIIQNLQNFEADIGFIEAYFPTPNLLIKPFMIDQLLLFAGATHPLANKKAIYLQDLKNALWVIREPGSGTREITEKYFSSVLKSENIYTELNTSEAIINLVKEGSSISCLSQLALQNALSSKKISALAYKTKKITRPFYQLIHKEKHQSDLIKLFLGYLEKEIKN